MKQFLSIIAMSLCLCSVAFAAPKTKKKVAPIDSNPAIVIDVESCVDKAIDYRVLMSTNPYDNVGKCYWLGFPMVKQQLFSRSIALIGFSGSQQNVFALMDFGEESVPMGMISGLVMGIGAYEYETVSGSLNTVHHLRKVGYLTRTKKQQQEKDARDKKEADEKAKQNLIKEAELQASSALALAESEKKREEELSAWNAAEPERIKEAKRLDDLKLKELEQSKQTQARKAELDRLVYVRSGLMWTKDANISGETMTWNGAIDWVKQLKLAGYSDWRLPTKEEIKEHGFPDGDGLLNIQQDYWTGSEDNVFMAWSGVSRYNRQVYENFKYMFYNVWPVRDTWQDTLKDKLRHSESNELKMLSL